LPVRRGTPRTLALDVGGTSIKALVLDRRGRPVGRREVEPTPRPATPAAVLSVAKALARRLGPFERVATGFPGVVVGGRVRTARNLAEDAWRGVDLCAALERAFGKPARVANDAVVQGYGAVRGRGVEVILTLGTGLGSALFVDGRPVPLELGHHPWIGRSTYEERLGEASRRRLGTARWRRLVERAVRQVRAVFLPDALFLGGGNAARLRGRPQGARIVDNDAGLLGAIRLWSDRATPSIVRRAPRGSRAGARSPRR
jgi:polyphosphate glucokinase